MKAFTTCMQCVWNLDIERDNRTTEELNAAHDAAMQYVRVVAEPACVVDCAKGHRYILLFQDLGHAMLFERALFHLLDGNARDAVVDGYTSLEMFLALVPVRARYDREKGANVSAIRTELSPALKTSDRAMAAAMTTVSVLTGKAPPSIPNSLAEARNQAVHQGKYPSIAKAEEHLVTIANVVGAFEDALDVQQCVNEAPFRVSVMHASLEELWRRDASTKELSVTTTSMGTALGSRGIVQQPMSIEERIANLKAGKGLLMFR